MITSLKPHEVFVFGSNATGFHGAGSAGLACRGDSLNRWRTDEWFLSAVKSSVGSPARVGKWAIYGVARGYQEGRDGRSYAIQTIIRPGQLRSVPLSEIRDQLIGMFGFANLNPGLTFLMTPVGAGYAGYTDSEMRGIWGEIEGQRPINVVAPFDLYQETVKHNT